MATCKDCVHERVCFALIKTGLPYADGEYPAEAFCMAFRNKSDFVEVVHGYWIDKPTGRYCHIGSYCSVCEEKSGIGGIESNRHKPYCPNCGAKMDGERTEE